MKTDKKFRGELSSGKFVYGDLVIWGGFETPRICSWDNGVIYDIKPDSFAQLVGYGKDGREVYEGDVLTDENGYTFSVSLEPHGCMFKEIDGCRECSMTAFPMIGQSDISNFRHKSD